MASKHEELLKKYGVTGKYANTKVESNGKQKKSASSKETTKQKLLDKYGVTGKYANKTNIVGKQNNNREFVPKQEVTGVKRTDFNTETTKAYKDIKDGLTTKVTIKSDLTEEERKKRTKEIKDELKTLKPSIRGLMTARNYGKFSKVLSDKLKEDEERYSALMKELKTLERVGTFTTEEVLQWEIDDAKRERANMGIYSPTARVYPKELGSFVQKNIDIYNADENIKSLERKMELYEDVDEFDDVVNKDDFEGQWRANYRSNELSRKADKAMSKYILHPTEENKQIAYAYDAFSKAYIKNNEKALDDKNVKFGWFSKSLAGYLPQVKDQALPETIGGLVGGLAGSTVGAPKEGAAIGAGLAIYPQTYEVVRGSVYRELLAAGVDEQIALEAANDEALISSIIESGGTAVDWLIFGSITSAAKKTVAKGGGGFATKFLAKLGAKSTTKNVTKMAAKVTKPVWKTAVRTGAKIGLDAGDEYVEEFAQGAVHRATMERGYSSIDRDIGQYGEGNIDLYNRPIYINPDGSISTVDSVTYQVDDKFVVLPSIARDENGKAKRLNTDEEILEHYQTTGEYLGEFDTQEEADDYANRLHYAQAYRYSDNTSTSIDDSTLSGSLKVLGDATFGGNTEAFGELHEQGVEGWKIGVMGGGIKGSVSNIVNHYSNIKTVKAQNEYVDTLINDEESLDMLIETGKEMGEGTVSAKIAEEVEQSKAKGKVTRNQVKRLIAANEVYINNEESPVGESDPLEQIAWDMVIERNEREKLGGIELLETRKRGKVTASMLNTLSENNVPITKDEVKKVTGFGDNGAELVANYANQDGVTFYQALKEVASSYTTGFEHPKEAGFDSTNLPSDVTESEKVSGIELLERRKKGQVTEEILNTLSEHNEPITKEEVKKVTGFGDNGAELIAKYSNEEGVSFSKVLNEVKSSYTTGLQQPDIDITNVSDAFISKAQQNAFTAGQMDSKMLSMAKKEDAKNAVVHKEAGFDSTNLPSDVVESEAQTVDLMAKALGVKSFMTSGLKGNAEINRATGEVPIDVNFEREIVVYGKPQKVSLVFHAAHEMAVHRVVEVAPEEGTAFVYAMYNALAGNEPSTYTLADNKRYDYAKQGVNISLAEAMEEVTANNILRLYDNDINKFHNAIDSIVNGEDVQAKKGLRKYIDYLNKMIRKILNFLSGKSAQEKAKMQPQLDEITKLRDMFETAFRKAVQNAKTMQNNNTNSTKNLEIKINEEYNGSTSHSLKWHTDLNRRQLAQVEKWIAQAGNPESTRITDTANWYKGRINGNDLFVIYSTEDSTGATILYERKGAEGKLELDILLKMLEDMENGRSIIETSKDIDPLLKGDWLREKHNLANSNAGLGGRGSNTGYAPILQRETSKFIGSQAFRNVIKNLLDIQAQAKQLKSYSLKEKDTEYLELAKNPKKNEARLRELLDEAAKENGYPVRAYHATNADYTVPDIDKTSEYNFYGKGMYFTNSLKDLEYNYENYEGPDPWQKIEARAYELASYKYDLSYEDTLTSEPEIVDKLDECFEEAISEFNTTIKRINAYLRFDNPLILEKGTGVTYDIDRTKYDGIIDKNVYENIGHAGTDENTIHYIVFNPHNIKSADLVTYDDEGKIIPLSERFNTKNDDIRYSLKDSDGNTLSEAQREYFKDSIVRDEKGNLLVMYHGTPNAGFTKFNPGTYFTEHKWYADRYQGQGASSLGYKKAANNPDTYAVYLNIKKPFDTRNEADKNIFYDEYYQQWGTGTDLMESGLPDWMDGMDLQEFLEEKGYDYDGIILDEGAVGGYGEEVVSRGISYVIFKPEQVKDIDNLNPTKNEDIRFSLKQPVEETKNLIALHNVREDKLLEAFKLGGLPSPSIAITKKDMLFDKFGDISLIFRKDSISPTDRRNKIYSGDAYTPTGVRVEYDIDDDILQEFNKKLKELTPEFTNERLPSVDSGTAEAENDSLYNAYERNDRAKFAFLREKGKAPKVAMRTPTLSGFATNDAIIALAKAFSSKQLNDIANTTEGVKQYKNACLKVIRDNSDSRVVESGIYSADSVSLWDVADVARLAAKVKKNKYKIKKEVDNRAIYDLIDKKFTNALKAEYKTWIDENTRDAIIDKGIRNNRDLFTPSGNRRSFKQLHEPYNLSNIVKQMFSGEDKGIALFGGSPIGAAQHLYSSIADVKADSGRIQDLEQEEYDKIRDSIEDDIFELARKMQINSDVFAVRDLLTEAIGKKTKQQADLHLKRESQGWAKYSPEFTNELWDIRERILNMPTQYFEAKPQRAVGFNEVVAAIIPRNKDKSLKTELENRGIKVLEYSKEKDGDRLKKINSVSDVSFSLKGTNNTNYKDRLDLVNTIEHLKNEFKVTKFAKADSKKLETMTKKLLKEYSSQAEFDDVFSSIDELYGYIANGEDGHPAVWDEVYRRAYNVSQNILDNAVAVYDELYKEYKDLREYLRSVPMKFDTKYDELPSGYDSFNEFRRNNFGRLNFRKDGTSIDGVYQELSSLYPEYFDSNRETDTSAQLDKIVETLDSLQPTEYNPYSDDMKLAASFLANDIIDNFFDIPQAKPTFADKAEQRVVDARISGIHKVEAVRKQRDAKIQKLMASQRAKTKKLIEKAKQSKEKAVDKEKAKRKATLDRMSESKKASVIRAKIIRHTGELNKTLLKATDKKHIPPELENAVLTLLYNINMESNYSYDVKTHSYKKNNEGLPTNKTKAFQQLKAVYEEIAKNNDYGLTIASELYDATNAGIGNIFDELMKLSDKKIADMTSEELTKVYDAIRLVEHSIATANKMFAMQKWENLTQTGKAFEKSVATRRPMPSLFNKRGTLDIETPITFFSHFGEAGMELYQALRDAQDNEQTMIDTLAEHIQGIVSLEQVQKAEKELFEFTTVSGEKLTLSKAHIMDIYLLYNRNQGKKHLLYDPESEHFGNGIHQPEIKSKRIRRATESTRLTKGDIGNILSKLTEEDKAIANKMQKATLLLAEWGNKACMDVFGYEKFKDPNYWTIKSAQESINQTLEKNKDIARAIKNMGSAKPIEDKATNALDIGGVFNVFNQHASDMISYSAWLGVMEDATKLYNYTFRDDDGFKTNKTFKGMLDKYAGNGGNKYYFNLLKDIQNGIGIAPDTSIENFYTKLFGMAAKAKVAFKLTVVAQQPMAIVRATDVLNPVSIAKAIGKGGLNLPVWAVSKVKNLSTKDSGQLLEEWYGGWERALKYSPIAKRKSIGGYEINSNSSGLKDVLYKPDTVKGKVIDAAKESPLWAAGKADQITWGILWNACEIETDKTTSYEKGSEAYYEDVNKLFTKVINETQVVDGVLQRSQMMRSSSGWVKPLTAFKGEPTMALNGVLRAYDNLRYETNPSKRGKAIKKFSRATTVFVMSAIFTAFARSLAVGVTGEDDEEYWKKVWKSFSGVQGDEETWFDFVKNIGLKSDAVNNINPFSWLPVTSELMSFAQGYDVERLDVASIGDFLQAGKNFVDSLDDEGKYKVGYATRNLLFKLAELTGYSPYNLVRDVEGAIRTSRVETNDVRGLYDMEKWKTKPAANVSKYIDILYKAYTTDEEAYDYIYNDLIENGVDAEKIKSGMESRMKKDEGVEKASDLSKRYMTPDVEKKYDNSLKKIKNSSTWKSANASERKEAEESLYNFLTSPSDAMEKTRKEAIAYGVDETEYTLMQLAKEMVNDDKPSMNAKEKAEAIKMLNLGNSELAYFYNTETADKAYENGVDIENFAMFKSAVSGLKGDNKKAMVDSYAEKYSRNTKEYLFFMGTEYPSYKKRRDYISYFGK